MHTFLYWRWTCWWNKICFEHGDEIKKFASGQWIEGDSHTSQAVLLFHLIKRNASCRLFISTSLLSDSSQLSDTILYL